MGVFAGGNVMLIFFHNVVLYSICKTIHYFSSRILPIFVHFPVSFDHRVSVLQLVGSVL